VSTLAQIKLKLVARNFVPVAFLRHALKQNLEQWERKQAGPFPHLLKQRIVRRYAAASGARVFVETGTYYGFMLQACSGLFDRLVSIEIEPHFYRRAQRIFNRHSNVTLLHGDSTELLPEFLATIRCPCLFWLDAHYSGGLTGKADIETPIRRELEAILDHSHRHTILIDDASSFDGTHDYPQIAWIEKVARCSGYSVSVYDNIIRLVASECRKSFENCA
jgi:hypothetical protein